MSQQKIKHAFNKILSLKKKKTHFGPNLGLLDPNLGQKKFLEVSALLDVRYWSKLQSCAISRKKNYPLLRKYQKTSFQV